jgi:putative heme iron utilization protein
MGPLDPFSAPGLLSLRSARSVKAAMANAPVDPDKTHAEAVADAKRLMRLSRTGALATLETEGGTPLTTLVGVASDFDGAPLFLMSTLSRHTRNLARDPRASLLLAGRHDRGDPLNHPRVTLGGRVELDPSGRAKSRYLQRNRKAALYAGFADFRMFRLRIESVHFNGGFGRAAPLAPADVLASRAGEAALTEAEERLIADVNGLGATVLAQLAGQKAARPVWRAIGLDGEGLDLAAGGRAARAQFRGPADHPATWRARLEELIDAR